MAGKSAKVITGLVRFAYVNVNSPIAVYDGEERYSISIIIPKKDKNTINSIISAVDIAMDKGKKKLEKARLEDIKMPVRDGDVERPEDKAYEGSYFINAYSRTRPQVVGRDIEPLKEEEFYSGCYGRVSITFYAYNHGGEVGIACGLGNIQKIKDGEALSSYSDPKVEFASFTYDYLGAGE